MPLFSSNREPSPEPVHEPESKKTAFFHRRDPDPAPAPVQSHDHSKKHGLFQRRDPSPARTNRTSTTSHSSHSSTDGLRRKSGSLLQRGLGRPGDDVDPSIKEARERVVSAENAEAAADRALGEARLRVREAREHMKKVEDEVEEEARRIKIKQQHAKEVSKRGQGLGRHGV